MEKKNTGLIVLVVILCLLVGGLTGYIIGNKTFVRIKMLIITIIMSLIIIKIIAVTI